MIPKLIMVPFSGKDSELGALETAAELAKRFHAHIDVCHVLPDPYQQAQSFSNGVADYFLPEFLREMEKRNIAAQAKAKKKFEQFLKRSGIAQRETLKMPARPTACFYTGRGTISRVLSVKARLADIVIISRGYGEDYIKSEDIAADIVFGSGKPVLFVPAGKNSVALDRKAIIAWNASPQATRAVAAALPLLAGGTAQVVSALEQDAQSFAISPHELVNYLVYHGIQAKPVLVKKKTKDAATYLLKTAQQNKATMIVMGAYTHNRVREMVLGGVTRHMLEKAKIPILLAH